MTLVNLTPHVVVLRGPQGDVTLPPDPRGPARLVGGTSEEIAADGFPVPVTIQSGPTSVVGLPPRSIDGPEGAEEEWFLVSRAVLDSALVAERSDLLAPGTGPEDGAVRDPEGRIVAVTRLVSRGAPALLPGRCIYCDAAIADVEAAKAHVRAGCPKHPLGDVWRIVRELLQEERGAAWYAGRDDGPSGPTPATFAERLAAIIGAPPVAVLKYHLIVTLPSGAEWDFKSFSSEAEALECASTFKGDYYKGARVILAPW